MKKIIWVVGLMLCVMSFASSQTFWRSCIPLSMRMLNGACVYSYECWKADGTRMLVAVAEQCD